MNRKHSNGPLESPWIRMWMSVHAKLWKCGRKTNPWDLTTSRDYHLRTIFCCEAKNVSPCQYEREGKGKEERRHEITSSNVISVGKILSACYQVVGGENVSRSQKDLFGFSFFPSFPNRGRSRFVCTEYLAMRRREIWTRFQFNKNKFVELVIIDLGRESIVREISHFWECSAED